MMSVTMGKGDTSAIADYYMRKAKKQMKNRKRSSTFNESQSYKLPMSHIEEEVKKGDKVKKTST